MLKSLEKDFQSWYKDPVKIRQFNVTLALRLCTISQLLCIITMPTGNPVSCAVTFHLFVMPCLWKMSGRKHPHHDEITAKVLAVFIFLVTSYYLNVFS